MVFLTESIHQPQAKKKKKVIPAACFKKENTHTHFPFVKKKKKERKEMHRWNDHDIGLSWTTIYAGLYL